MCHRKHNAAIFSGTKLATNPNIQRKPTVKVFSAVAFPLWILMPKTITPQEMTNNNNVHGSLTQNVPRTSVPQTQMMVSWAVITFRMIIAGNGSSNHHEVTKSASRKNTPQPAMSAANAIRWAVRNPDDDSSVCSSRVSSNACPSFLLNSKLCYWRSYLQSQSRKP